MNHKDYIQNGLIIKHLNNVVNEIKFNRFVTISFIQSKHGTPLRKSDIPLVINLFRVYFKRISEKLNGRSRATDKIKKSQIPALAFPEYKSELGDNIHLHYHALVKIPECQIEFFENITETFWKKVSRNTIGYMPKIDHRPAYNPGGAARYSLKNIEDQFTIENMVYSRLSLT